MESNLALNAWLQTHGARLSLEEWTRKLYFMQTSGFHLLDAARIFKSYASETENCITNIRDIEEAMTKVLQLLYTSHCNIDRDTLQNIILASKAHDLDSIREQIACRAAVLSRLEASFAQLVQGFHRYGVVLETNSARAGSNKANGGISVPVITLDGFIGLLRAHSDITAVVFLEELRKTFQEMMKSLPRTCLPNMAIPLKEVRNSDAKSTKRSAYAMTFPCYLEFICRTASLLSSFQAKQKIGSANIASRNCALEANLEMFFDTLRWTESNDAMSDFLSFDSDTEDLRVLSRMRAEDKEEKIDEIVVRTDKIISAAPVIRRMNELQKNVMNSVKAAWDSSIVSSNQGLLQLVLIKEIIPPITLTIDELDSYQQILLSQHSDQFQASLKILRDLYERQKVTRHSHNYEDQIFLLLIKASIYESAHLDTRALELYLFAFDKIDLLPPLHPFRTIIKSSLGSALYYVGKLDTSIRCHELALIERLHSAVSITNTVLQSAADQKIQIAKSMNNLACALGSIRDGRGMKEAYSFMRQSLRIYKDHYGIPDRRTDLVTRNHEQIKNCQISFSSSSVHQEASERFMHVITKGSFQIMATIPKTKSRVSRKKKSDGTAKFKRRSAR